MALIRGAPLGFVAGLVLGAALVASLSALGASRANRHGPRSTVIYPEQRIPLRFFHDRHLRMGIACELCHSAALTSESTADSLVPDHTKCRICHAIDAPDAATRVPRATCDTCHPGFVGTTDPAGPVTGPARVVIPPANVHFSHKRHLDQGVACVACHEGMESVGLATRDQLPTMPTCVACHTDRGVSTECATCHLTDTTGTLARDLPGASGPLKPSGRFLPADHRAVDWGREHRAAARAAPGFCAACHTETECESCHDGVLKPDSIHPGDWVATHGREATTDALRCEACHEQAASCTACHAAAGLTRETFPGVLQGGTRRFHPAGWTAEIVGPDHHSVSALRGIGACAACHGEDQGLCVQCHVAFNPHGVGFGDSARAAALARARPEMCLQCHAPGTLDLLGGR